MDLVALWDALSPLGRMVVAWIVIFFVCLGLVFAYWNALSWRNFR